MVEGINRALAETDVDEVEITANLIVMRFTEAVQEMIGDPIVKRSLPKDTVQTLQELREIANGTMPQKGQEDEKTEGT